MTYRPLFVFGLARSGTNLLARMLDCHPAVAMGLDPFLPLFNSLRNALVAAHASAAVRQGFSPASPFHDYYFHRDGTALLDLILSAERADLFLDASEVAVLRQRVAERAALESPVLGRLMGKLDGADFGALFKSGVGIISEIKPEAAWVGCKEVWVIEFLPLLARIFPEARFYVIERDPRAIVASLLAMAAKDPTQAAHAPSYMRHWRKQVALARRFESNPELAGRFRCISYEQLATNPEEEAVKLCVELGVQYIPAMLRLSASGWAGNSSYEDQSRDIYTRSNERWRQTLPERVIQAVDFLCGPEMVLTPYSPVAQPRKGEVLSCLEEAGRTPGSWRSDSGDLLVDFGGELVRHALLEKNETLDEQLARRCFLFRDTLDAIRRANA